MAFRFFQGKQTQQVHENGSAAAHEYWYYEPDSYVGDVLWSTAYLTRELAEAAAAQDSRPVEYVLQERTPGSTPWIDVEEKGGGVGTKPGRNGKIVKTFVARDVANVELSKAQAKPEKGLHGRNKQYRLAPARSE